MTTNSRRVYKLIAIMVIFGSVAAIVFLLPLSRRPKFEPENLSSIQIEIEADFLGANSGRVSRVVIFSATDGSDQKAYRVGNHVSLQPPEYMLPDGSPVLTRHQKNLIADYTLVKNPFYPIYGLEDMLSSERYSTVSVAIIIAAHIGLVAIGLLVLLIWYRSNAS